MKKMIFIGLLFISAVSFAQIAKADFVAVFSKFKFENMTGIWTKNTKNYSNGTAILEQVEFKADCFTYELKDNAIYLMSYDDATKAKLNSCMIIPYDKIQKLAAAPKGITIDFSE